MKRVIVTRVPLDPDGYDPATGIWYGISPDGYLYALDPDGEPTRFVRAWDAVAAQNKAKRFYPSATVSGGGDGTYNVS